MSLYVHVYYNTDMNAYRFCTLFLHFQNSFSLCLFLHTDCMTQDTDSLAWIIPMMVVEGFLLLGAVPVIVTLCILNITVCAYV